MNLKIDVNINLSNEEIKDFLIHMANILGKNFNTLNPFLDITFLTYRLSAVHPIIAKERKGGVYTIVEEKNGFGRLKSGAGWISLDCTEKK